MEFSPIQEPKWRVKTLLMKLESDRKHGTVPLHSRTQAATQAGLSERQRKTALRVANVPQADFESAVESEHPPTITKLAELGKQERKPPTITPPSCLHQGSAHTRAGVRRLAVA